MHNVWMFRDSSASPILQHPFPTAMEWYHMQELSRVEWAEVSRSKRQDQWLLYSLNLELIERKLLRPGQRVLVAVSGGQDSTCMVNMLHKLRCPWHWRLAVVYCDHNWYSRSRLQGGHVAQLASNIKASYYQAASAQALCSESIARDWRYGVIQRIAARHKHTAVASGHSASDRIETLVYNLVRGSGPTGLHSLSWKRHLKLALTASTRLSNRSSQRHSQAVCYRHSASRMRVEASATSVQLVRPLLSMSRTELRCLMRQWQLAVWPDPSNQNIQMRRNRIRHQLLPYLRHCFNPKVDHVLANWAETAHAESRYLEALARCIRAVAEVCVLGKQKCGAIDAEVLRALPVALQRCIFRQWLQSEHAGSQHVKFASIEQLRAVSSLRRALVPVNVESSRDSVLSKQ